MRPEEIDIGCVVGGQLGGWDECGVSGGAHVTIFRRRTQEIAQGAHISHMWYVFLTTCCFRLGLRLLLEIDMLCACVRDIGIVTGWVL